MEISQECREAWENNPENAAFEAALSPHIKPHGKLDIELLFRLAEENGVDDAREKYADLNPGQVRMNLGNRLRPRWKDDRLVALDGRKIEYSGPQLSKNQPFTISHADDGKFEGAGLRVFFEYRQLGIPEATDGKFGAHVIRAVPGEESPGAWHRHDLDFQMVYVTQGWVVFEYEGQGEHLLRAGSCVLQPPGIVHREVRHSDDMELLEITSPAEFDTRDEEAPASAGGDNT